MGSGVDDGEKEHGVRRLPVEPLALVEGQKGDLRPQNSDDITAHRQQDEASVERQNQTGAARNPHRVLQCVQRGQSFARVLRVPVKLLDTTLYSE